MMVNLKNRPWRVGRKVGRTIYAQITDVPRDDDPLIGVLDTRELAERVVADHNKSLAEETHDHQTVRDS